MIRWGLAGYPWKRVGGLMVKSGFTIRYRNFPDFFSAYGFFSKTFLGIAEKKVTKKSQTHFSFCRYDAGQNIFNRDH